MKTYYAAALAIALIVFYTIFAISAQRVSIARVRADPMMLRLRITVTPSDENRWLTVLLEGPDKQRQSSEQLDGAEAFITHWMEWRELPSGEYVATARVSGVGGKVVGFAVTHALVQ